MNAYYQAACNGESGSCTTLRWGHENGRRRIRKRHGAAGRSPGGAACQGCRVRAGGFEANIEWLKKAWGEAADNFLIRGTPSTRPRAQVAAGCGRPNRWAIRNNATPWPSTLALPKFDGGIVTRLDCLPLGIVVNRDGVPFLRRGRRLWPKCYAIWGRLVAEQPGKSHGPSIDSKVVGRFIPSVFPRCGGFHPRTCHPRWVCPVIPLRPP